MAAGLTSASTAMSVPAPGWWGVATQHRIYAALREFCNFEVRKTRRMAFNLPDNGTPWRPDYVTRHFEVIAKAAGLPVIKLHEGIAPQVWPGMRPSTQSSAARHLVTPTRP